MAPASTPKAKAGQVAPLQWVVATVALVVVVASFGLVLYRGVAYDTEPAVLTVSGDSVALRGTAYAWYVTARNEGGTTAADVHIEGVVNVAGTAERSTVVLDFVPAGSRAAGVLLFSADPRARSSTVRITGYRQP